MEQDRRTNEYPIPGEDPREIDREKTDDEVLDEVAAQDGIVHQPQPQTELGVSSDRPGRDLSELEEAPEVPRHRDTSDPRPRASDSGRAD
jgi:hypothetical protein